MLGAEREAQTFHADRRLDGGHAELDRPPSVSKAKIPKMNTISRPFAPNYIYLQQWQRRKICPETRQGNSHGRSYRKLPP